MKVTPDQIAADAARIDALGGPTEVAKLLSFSAFGSASRVANWKKKGVPWEIRFHRADLFPLLKSNNT